MKLCIIGAGKRVHEMYVPLLKTMNGVEIAGIWNRTSSKLSSLNFWKIYDDQQLMIRECQPDALLIIVNSASIKQVVLDCMKYDIPIIMETPVYDNDISQLSSKKKQLVLVNEQTPYLPCEEFKMKLLMTGIFGEPNVVINDFRTYEFHGIAQLRRYIGYQKQPVEVIGSCTGHRPITYYDNNDKLQHHTEACEFGVIKFNTGQTAVYNFSSIYNRAPFRKPRSMRIYCQNGTISNDDNDFVIHYLNNQGMSQKLVVNVQGQYMNTDLIECKIDGITVMWKKDEEAKDLNDQQNAIREILRINLNAIKCNDQNLGYSAHNAFMDVNLLNAIRFSSQSKKFIC